MTPQDQTILHDPDSGAVGNCMQAAIATLLGLDMEEVPHFAALPDWDGALAAWCASRRLLWVSLSLMSLPDDMPCILTGTSPRGIAHVVVGRGVDTIHDPHPSRAGLRVKKTAWVFAPYLPDPLA